MTSKLAAMQARLAQAIRSPHPLGCDTTLARLAAEIAGEGGPMTPVDQLDVYREQFWLRHLDCLRDDFASIAWCLGDDAFEALGRSYIAAFPPTSFSLRDLGMHLVSFLEQSEPTDPFVVDLARVEWAFVEAFDAPDARRFDPASLMGRSHDDWAGARIVLDPSVQRLALEHPAHDYRDAVQRDGRPTRPAPRPTWVVVSRAVVLAEGPVLHGLEIERDAFALLDELARGVPLGKACANVAIASDLSTFQAELSGWFEEWTSRGIVRDVLF